MAKHSVFSTLVLTGTLLCAVVPLAAEKGAIPRSGIDAKQERDAALRAEKAGDWDAALLHYENLYDSTPTKPGERDELRKKFAELRPKVKPNADPAKAGAWKVKAYMFRALDYRWKDSKGNEHHAEYRYSDDEIKVFRRGMAGFADRVWEFSSGNLRIVWDLTVLEKSLTKLDGEDSFWPGPDACMPHLADLKRGEADTIMVFVKTSGSEQEAGESIPLMLLGGMLPVLRHTKGATYIGFNWGSGACSNEPDGEPMLHEWLHAAQWTLEHRQGYPEGLMHTSDGGRMEGEKGGDPCYRRKTSESSWMRFYQHLMRDHATRRMWRELALKRGK